MKEIWGLVNELLLKGCNFKITYDEGNKYYILTIFNKQTKWQVGVAISPEVLTDTITPNLLIIETIREAYEKSCNPPKPEYGDGKKESDYRKCEICQITLSSNEERFCKSHKPSPLSKV